MEGRIEDKNAETRWHMINNAPPATRNADRVLDRSRKKKEGLVMKPIRTGPVGFTLVEILVVVTIIGLLAALAVPTVGGAINSARKSKAMTMAHQIRVALVQFNTEYGFFLTNVGGFNDRGIGSTDGGLALVLTGSTNSAATNWNPRAIAFLEVPAEFTMNGRGDVTNDGIVTPKNLFSRGPDKGRQLRFNVSVDHNYDGRVDVTNNSQITNIPGTVAVWIVDPSDTKNKTSGTWK
jgi:prepilin-type N-terminal cleavage/methylation domain-containing protein